MPVTFLLAEDNPVNREVAGSVLEILGCTTAFVENGKEAVDAVANHPFDLILMDCHMRKWMALSGLYVPHQLTHDRGTGSSRTPIA